MYVLRVALPQSTAPCGMHVTLEGGCWRLQGRGGVESRQNIHCDLGVDETFQALTVAVVWNGLPVGEVYVATVDLSTPILNVLDGTYTLMHNVALLCTKGIAIKVPRHAECGSVGREHQGLGLSPWPVGGCWLRWNGCTLCQRCISQDLESKRKQGC